MRDMTDERQGQGQSHGREGAGANPGQGRVRCLAGTGRSGAGAAAELGRGRFQGRRGAGPRTGLVKDPGVAAAEAEPVQCLVKAGAGLGLAWAGQWRADIGQGRCICWARQIQLQGMAGVE
jgi:hypothetical protein